MAKKPDDDHKVELPDFDTLIDINQKDPEALTRLRQRLSDDFLDSCPDSSRRRLEGLLFRINMELRRARNPATAYLRLSDMMYSSFSELHHSLHQPEDLLNKENQRGQNQRSADILSFPQDHSWKGNKPH
ncbi:hypothetical protein GCM10011403_11070 [Pseudohongiella nitratireducens]|uniref:DUF3135 domain-containing protein n=1 Tax=Pseudohongiella nitratireducens TaxID=1768907 RepID=A0A917LU97_9GAMM|nr:DUF3135 domain-containing protein [Pseudohongiella nitratireducens]MDF1621922.1 DUF3135 domain-containing protein [Pseudohongiella nitratireducens]GGG55739.1 hypothetical protein GCM10011403_11070 [Pseudohongiella nitratireducens]|tara:strand:+ start:3545 stop:3934 length:390 start_codon:yes stop_codon:yes gene_type:complete